MESIPLVPEDFGWPENDAESNEDVSLAAEFETLPIEVAFAVTIAEIVRSFVFDSLLGIDPIPIDELHNIS